MGAALPIVALASAGVSAVGAVTGAVGQYNAAQSQADMQRYQAQVAQNNAALDETKSNMASQQGEVDATAQGMKNRAQQGQIRAAIGASGVDPNTGSAAEVQSGAAALGMQDTMTVRSNAAKQAWGYKVEASNAENQATMDMTASHNTRSAALGGALGSFLSGISSAAGGWAKYGLASGDIGGSTGGGGLDVAGIRGQGLQAGLPGTDFYDDPALIGVS